MAKYKSNRGERDMTNAHEQNNLYEIVKLYGAYLLYIRTGCRDSFDVFFEVRNQYMSKSFINCANADAKAHLSYIRGISGNKMRKLLITNKNKPIVSYDWIYLYFEYILNECNKIDALEKNVKKIMSVNCYECLHVMNLNISKALCSKHLLGFQYMFLHHRSTGSLRSANNIKNILMNIENSSNILEIIQICKSNNIVY
ncbi:MAG: hypothetical protein Q4G60_07170 [bacterium]|nr:hypothetical protein [bacterium]